MARQFGFKRQVSMEEPTINLTALIDVVFVVLIMFIMIAPLLDLDRIELAAAAPNSAQENHLSVQEASLIAIHVQKDNTIYINKDLTPETKLLEKLKKAKALFPNARPQLFHDKKAQFGTYQVVKNALEMVGYKEVDIVLKP